MTHLHRRLILALLIGLPLIPAAGWSLATGSESAIHLPPATAGPRRIFFARDGALLLATEADRGTVAVIDVKSGRLLRRLPAGGQRPMGGALASSTLIVANQQSGVLAFVNVQSGGPEGRIYLPGEPAEVVLTASGTEALVTLPGRDELVEVDLPGRKVRRRLRLGRRPQALALTPDKKLAVVANFQSGDVSVVDLASWRELSRIPLNGVNLRGLSVTPDGSAVLVTGQIAANTRATREPLDIWTNTLFRVDLTGVREGRTPRPSAEGWLDFSSRASPDPDGVVAIGPELAVVSLAGSDEVLLVRTPGPHLRTYDPQIVGSRRVDARPGGLAIAPDGRTIWVACELGSSLIQLDSTSLDIMRRIPLEPGRRRDLTMAGRYLFGHAGLTSGGQFTCASCHPDGRQDGLTWEFAHVPDEIRLRNTRSLRGQVTLTGPFRWSGHDADIEEFVQQEITGLLKGPPQGHGVLHQFWNLLDDLPLPPNPYRDEDGSPSPQARRGALLFTGKAACASCHSGERYGGSGIQAYVGTSEKEQPLDVPHLAGAYDSAPYLHDGRAKSLEAIFSKYNPERKHGAAHLLSDEEMADLVAYIRSL